MALGDILSVAVGADGWYADITIEGLSTGGTYDFGFGANNDPTTGTPKVVFTVVSKGFDDTGAATTITRTVCGTKQVRKSFPNEDTMEETAGGGNVTVRVALSDYIFQKDATGAGNSGTAPVVSILGGFYTQGGTPNNASGAGFAVTNNSTAAHPKTVANWAWPGYQVLTASTKLRAVAFHRSGQQGKPVRAVKFSVTDGTTTNTEVVTVPTVDTSVGDDTPVVEYVSTTDLVAGLTQGAELTVNFVAYPWVGDDGARLNTDLIANGGDGYAAPTPLAGPLKGVCDRLGTYGKTIVLVDPAGNDTTGAAYDSASFDEGTAAACLTINGAMVKAAAYNNTNRSRNDLGNVEIRLKAGTYAWTGGSGSIGTVPKTWCVVTRANSAARSDVILATMSGDSDATDRVCVRGVKITGTSNLFFNGCEALWLDNVEVDQTGVNTGYALVYGTSNWWVTRSTITSLHQGLRPYSTQNTPCCLIRGNTMASGGFQGYTILGNRTTAQSSFRILMDYTGQTSPAFKQPILAFNNFRGINCNTASFFAYHWGSSVHGVAVVQNVFENYITASSPIMAFSGDNSGGTESADHCILWHNVFVGQRVNYAYNDEGPNLVGRRYWSIKNNIFDDPNIKTDLFARGLASITRVGTTATATISNSHRLTTGDTVTIMGATPAAYNGVFVVTVSSSSVFTYTMASDPGASASPAGSFIAHKTNWGNWGVVFGAGMSGNMLTHTTGIGTAAFTHATGGDNGNYAFAGVRTIENIEQAATYHKFTDRKSYTVAGNGAGFGDYTLQSDSPAKGLQLDWVLPFDLAGNPRTATSDAGAYAPPIVGTGRFFLLF